MEELNPNEYVVVQILGSEYNQTCSYIINITQPIDPNAFKGCYIIFEDNDKIDWYSHDYKEYLDGLYQSGISYCNSYEIIASNDSNTFFDDVKYIYDYKINNLTFIENHNELNLFLRQRKINKLRK